MSTTPKKTIAISPEAYDALKVIRAAYLPNGSLYDTISVLLEDLGGSDESEAMVHSVFVNRFEKENLLKEMESKLSAEEIKAILNERSGDGRD